MKDIYEVLRQKELEISSLEIEVEALRLARIIHIFEDNKSLLCYKHVV